MNQYPFLFTPPFASIFFFPYHERLTSLLQQFATITFTLSLLHLTYSFLLRDSSVLLFIQLPQFCFEVSLVVLHLKYLAFFIMNITNNNYKYLTLSFPPARIPLHSLTSLTFINPSLFQNVVKYDHYFIYFTPVNFFP